MMRASTNQDFAAALKDRTSAPPVGLVGIAERRFAVYRNNVAVGLIKALETRFRAVLDLVGEEFFRAMAREFVAAHPPSSPVLMSFGDLFADFIADFAPARQFSYLPDIARIEAARTRAYHAPDMQRLGPGAFASIAPEQLGDLRLSLHPAVAVIRSAYPAYTIFGMSTGAVPAARITDWHSQDTLIDRPQYDATVRLLPPGGALFLSSLQTGEPLGVAASVAAQGATDFDLSANLADLIGSGMATHLIAP